MTNTALNRTTIVQLTNKSGSNLAQGAVVVIDRDNDSSFETTTTSGYTTTNIGVVFEPNGIANNATGGVALAGWVPTVLVSGTASRGWYIRTSPAAGEAYQFSSAGAGDFGITLENGDAPEAYLFGNTTQSVGGGDSPASSTIIQTLIGLSMTNTVAFAETLLGTITIPANTFTQNSVVRIKAVGTVKNASGTTQEVDLYLKADGSGKDLVYHATLPNAAFDRPWRSEYILYTNGSNDIKYIRHNELFLSGTFNSTTFSDNSSTFISSATLGSPITIEVYGYMGTQTSNIVLTVSALTVEGPFDE